jgi:hypothetical protein
VAALTGTVPVADLTSRTIQGYVTAKFAEQLGAATWLKDGGTGRALFVAAAR